MQHLVVIEHQDSAEQRTVYVDRDLLPLPGEAAAYVTPILATDWFVREVIPA